MWPRPNNIITFVAGGRNILSIFDDGRGKSPLETMMESELIGIVRPNCRCVVGYPADNRAWGRISAGIA